MSSCELPEAVQNSAVQLSENDLSAISRAVTAPVSALLAAHEKRLQEQLNRFSFRQDDGGCVTGVEEKKLPLSNATTSPSILSSGFVAQPPSNLSVGSAEFAQSVAAAGVDQEDVASGSSNMSSDAVRSAPSSRCRNLAVQEPAEAWWRTAPTQLAGEAFCRARGWSKAEGSSASKGFQDNGAAPVTERAMRDAQFHLSRLQSLITSSAFDAVSALMIVGNAATLGYNVQRMAHLVVLEPPAWNAGAQLFFTCWFTLEVALRAWAFKSKFCSSAEREWNIFDIVVVSSSIIETLIYFLVGGTGSNTLALIRVLRILRLVRVVRVIRVVRFLKELRLMVYSSLRCGKLWVWAMGFILMLIYMFGIHLTQVATEYRHDNPPETLDLETRERLETLTAMYGSLYESMLTLFQCISGGVSWRDAVTPLQLVHWSYGIWMSMFVSFMTLAVLNIVTGIFVGSTVECASNEADTIIADEMEEENSHAQALLSIFQEADLDGDGFVDFQEFDVLLKDHGVRAYLHKLGVDPSEAMGLFRLLDLRNMGQVNGKEFVLGCMRLKGPAKNVDVATILAENKRLMDAWGTFMKYVEDQLTSLRLDVIATRPLAASTTDANVGKNVDNICEL